MVNQKSLSAFTTWYSIGNFFIRSISFILLPLYSNILSTSEFGNYSLLISLYAMVSVLYQAGMQNSLTKFYLGSENPQHRKIVFSSVINFVAILGLLLILLSLVFSKGISNIILGTSEYSKIITLVFTALFFETMSYFFLHLLKTKELVKQVVITSCISALINLSMNIFFVYYLRMSIEGIFISQLISSFVLVLLLLPSVLPEIQISIDKSLLKKMFIFSLPFLIGGIFSSAVDVSDRFILNIFTNKDEVGIYSLSYKIAMLMNVFVISFRTAWIPRALNVYRAENHSEVFGNMFKKLISVSSVILISVTLFSPYLFQIKLFNVFILNKNYEAGLIILPFILLGYLFSGLGAFYSLFPFVSSKSYYFLYSDLIAFIVNLILNFILIPMVGMIGAAVATTLAFFASAVFLFWISKSKIKIYYPMRDIITIATLAVIILIIGLVYKNLILELSLFVVYLFSVLKLTKINLRLLFRIA